MKILVGIPAALLVPALLLGCAAAPATQREVTVLVSDLQSEAGETRQAAAAGAGAYGPAAFDEVAALLESERPEVRKCAEQALFNVAHHASRPGHGEEREQVARSALNMLCDHPDAATRDALFRIFSLTATQSAGDRRLRGLLLDQETADGAFRALARIDHPRALAHLIERLPDPRAIRALGDLGNQAAVRPLLDVSEGRDEKAAREARHALARMGASSARDLLEQAWRRDEEGAADDLLLLAERLLQRGERAVPREIFTAFAAADEPLLRVAAAAGLGRSGGTGSFELLVRLLADRADVRGAAVRSLAGLEDRSTGERLRALCRSDQAPERAAGLRALALREPEGSGRWIRELLEDPDVLVRGAAIELCAEQTDFELTGPLLRLAGEGTGDERLAALAAALVQIRRSPKADEAETLLEQARELDEGGDLAEEQLAAELAIAARSIQSRPERAQIQLERVLFESGSAARRTRALQLLKELGADVAEYPRRAGFLVDWKLLGPLESAAEGTLAKLPFDLDPDLDAELAGKHGGVRWTPHHVEGIEGRVPLDAIFDGEQQATALAYCEFPMREGEGLLEIGSDDGVAAWLNGELVHEHEVARPLTVDQDRVPVRFREGRNRLLVKISQGGGEWAFCVRLADASGQPIDRTAD